MAHLSINRRQIMAVSAAAALTPAGFAKAAARMTDHFTMDILSYGPAGNRAAFAALRDAGMSAVTVDIFAHPRIYATAKKELEAYNNWEQEPDAIIRIIRKHDDFARARAEKRLGVVLASQDASILGTGYEDYGANLSEFHALGLRVLQLTHNRRTAFGDSYMEKRDGGLSLAGADLINKMNTAGVVVDLSHCSALTVHDAVAASKKPVVFTHMGVHALAPTLRNKKDPELKAVAQSGGVIGVFGLTTWLTDGPEATMDTVLAHIDYIAEHFGPAHAAFGSDGFIETTDAETEMRNMGNVQKANAGGPSAEWPVLHTRIPALNSAGRMAALADALAARGYKDDDIAGIIGGNFRRVFKEAIG